MAHSFIYWENKRLVYSPITVYFVYPYVLSFYFLFSRFNNFRYSYVAQSVGQTFCCLYLSWSSGKSDKNLNLEYWTNVCDFVFLFFSIFFCFLLFPPLIECTTNKWEKTISQQKAHAVIFTGPTFERRAEGERRGSQSLLKQIWSLLIGKST